VAATVIVDAMFRASTSGSCEPISTPQSILAPETLTLDRPGLIDTSVAVELSRIQITSPSGGIAASTLTVAELAGGPHAATDEVEKARRQHHLRYVEESINLLSFDAGCARAYGRIYAAVERTGRKARGANAVDPMIAATALAHDLPLYTFNTRDLRGLSDLIEIIDIGRRLGT
jgi:predicted nucleic acid-binding protein